MEAVPTALYLSKTVTVVSVFHCQCPSCQISDSLGNQNGLPPSHSKKKRRQHSIESGIITQCFAQLSSQCPWWFSDILLQNGTQQRPLKSAAWDTPYISLYHTLTFSSAEASFVLFAGWREGKTEAPSHSQFNFPQGISAEEGDKLPLQNIRQYLVGLIWSKR